MKQIESEIENKQWLDYLSFECLGVRIGVRADSGAGTAGLMAKLNDNLSGMLPIGWKKIDGTQVEHWFSVLGRENLEGEIRLYKNSDMLLKNSSVDEHLNLLESKIRMTVAEFTEKLVFLHAGVVGWKGKAIIIPGKSFTGKTTLVAEFIKRGCEYFSDEYAMLGKDGLVYPFPKKLSLRGIVNDYTQVDFTVEELGGTRARKPISMGFLLITEYKKKAKPNLKTCSIGEGIMACVANSISIRHNPEFVLEVLSKIVNRAIVLKTKRGEASEFVDFFLNYFKQGEFDKTENEFNSLQVNF